MSQTTLESTAISSLTVAQAFADTDSLVLQRGTDTLLANAALLKSYINSDFLTTTAAKEANLQTEYDTKLGTLTAEFATKTSDLGTSYDANIALLDSAFTQKTNALDTYALTKQGDLDTAVLADIATLATYEGTLEDSLDSALATHVSTLSDAKDTAISTINGYATQVSSASTTALADIADAVSDAQAALQESGTDLTTLQGNIGTLTSLTTTDKDSLVKAINEVVSSVSTLSTTTGTLTTTTNSLKATTTEVTLTSTSWSGDSAPYTYTISDEDITTTSVVEIAPNSPTSEQLEAMTGAKIIGGATSSGSFTLLAYGDKPTVDLPIKMILRGC